MSHQMIMEVLFGYTWVSFGLEAASWRLRNIFTVLLWPPTTMSVQRCLVPWRGDAMLSESQGQRPGLAPPFGRGMEDRIKYLQCATVALQF